MEGGHFQILASLLAIEPYTIATVTARPCLVEVDEDTGEAV
jgi:hypothetical protein